ncbi:MAG: hypothetical protein IT437_08700 [Phycisphaerales bacterium]|nr:hypothetical protein [Steroidobacteraceae bacterium]MCC6660951.1 hypothetical protein [Phycisphaerales bacterium]
MPELMTSDPIVREDLARLRAQNERLQARIQTLEARVDNQERMLALLGQPSPRLEGRAAVDLDRPLHFR